MPTINIFGVPHVYELTEAKTHPSTPILVFIHGWLLSRHYWQPLVQRLGHDYSCLVYDLRGFGETQKKETSPTNITENHQLSYTLEAYAQDLILLLEKLDINNAWLVGHSLGGSIALWGAKLCPKRVKGVIGVNAGGGIYIKEEFERFQKIGQQIVQNRPPWLAYIPRIDWLFARMMVAKPLTRHWGRQRVIDFLIADETAAIESLLTSTTESEVHLLPQIVANLAQPVYFFAGAQDKVMEAKYVRYLASFHPLFQAQGLNVIELSHCGHLAMVEKPELIAEKITKIILENH